MAGAGRGLVALVTFLWGCSLLLGRDAGSDAGADADQDGSADGDIDADADPDAPDGGGTITGLEVDLPEVAQAAMSVVVTPRALWSGAPYSGAGVVLRADRGLVSRSDRPGFGDANIFETGADGRLPPVRITFPLAASYPYAVRLSWHSAGDTAAQPIGEVDVEAPTFVEAELPGVGTLQLPRGLLAEEYVTLGECTVESFEGELWNMVRSIAFIERETDPLMIVACTYETWFVPPDLPSAVRRRTRPEIPDTTGPDAIMELGVDAETLFGIGGDDDFGSGLYVLDPPGATRVRSGGADCIDLDLVPPGHASFRAGLYWTCDGYLQAIDPETHVNLDPGWGDAHRPWPVTFAIGSGETYGVYCGLLQRCTDGTCAYRRLERFNNFGAVQWTGGDETTRRQLEASPGMVFGPFVYSVSGREAGLLAPDPPGSIRILPVVDAGYAAGFVDVAWHSDQARGLQHPTGMYLLERVGTTTPRVIRVYQDLSES